MGIKTRIWGLAGVGALAVTSLLVPLAAPAGAATATLATDTANCNFGQFPNQAGGQSNLTIACNFPADSVRPAIFMNDFPSARWHQGASRTVSMTQSLTDTNKATFTVGTTAWASAADVNHQVSGTNVAPYTQITAVSIASGVATVTFSKDIPAGTTKFQIENSSIRQVNTGSTTADSTTVTSATANFRNEDVGRSIDATNLPVGTTIVSRTDATTVEVSNAAIASGTNQVLSIGASAESTSARFATSNTHLPASAAGAIAQSKTGTKWNAVLIDGLGGFGATDTNLAVSGKTNAGAACLAGGTYITAVVPGSSLGAPAGSTAALLSKAPTAQCDWYVIGSPSLSAPKDGDVIGQLSSTIMLNPALVPGSAACSEAVPYGTTIQGQWTNPGKYADAPPALTGPFGVMSGVGAGAFPLSSIAQIAFKTAVTSFYGYVQQKGANFPFDPQTAAHYTIVMPTIPTVLATCEGTGTTTSFRFSGSTTGTSANPTGVGRPGTAARGLLRPATSTQNDVAYLIGVDGTNPNVVKYGVCTVRQTGVYGLPCGD